MQYVVIENKMRIIHLHNNRHWLNAERLLLINLPRAALLSWSSANDTQVIRMQADMPYGNKIICCSLTFSRGRNSLWMQNADNSSWFHYNSNVNSAMVDILSQLSVSPLDSCLYTYPIRATTKCLTCCLICRTANILLDCDIPDCREPLVYENI